VGGLFVRARPSKKKPFTDEASAAQQLTTVSALSSSLSLARETQTTFNPREGHAWRIAAEVEDSGSDEETEGQDQQQADQKKKENSSNTVPSLLVTDVAL
jgi:hypothetical protein